MAHLELTCFGAFQATIDGEPITTFRSVNVQGILVYLALQADQAISRDVIAALFWPNESESVARANLRQSLYQLRKVLQTHRSDASPFLLITRQTLQFNPRSDYRLDVIHFQRALQEKDWETASRCYRGELLPGFHCESESFEQWLRFERERRHQEALDALSLWTEQQIHQGNLSDAQKTAQRQLVLEAWRESAHRQLMQALALAGDRSGALAQFERCYEILQKELGVEPEEATITLYEQIATNVIAPTVAAQALPQPPTTFIGRVAEISYLIQQLNRAECHVVTLVGAGGVGKTRLAIEVAHCFVEQTKHEAYFVSLLGVTTIEQALEQTAHTLGIAVLPLDPALHEEQRFWANRNAGPHHTRGKNQAMTQIIGKLQGTSSLLLFDNAEPLLVADGPAFVDCLNELSTALPNLRILVTSRQALQAQQEWILPIHGLAYPAGDEIPDLQQWAAYDAIHFFQQRAQQARVTFAITAGNISDVIQLCRLVDGLPLALELAAAQVRHKSLHEIVISLVDQPLALHADLQDLPPRHRSLQSVFAQSWALLTVDEQRILDQAAVFAGEFDRVAARAVLGNGAQHLEQFVEKSLLMRCRVAATGTQVRYGLPPALRAFIQSLAKPALNVEEDADVHNRHASYYLQWAVMHPQSLADERANLVAAWSWAQANPNVAVPAEWNAACLQPLTPPVGGGPSRSQSILPAVLPPPLLLGRDAELSQLHSVVHRLSQEQKNGGLITIVGDAGIGKSYLVAHLRTETPQITWCDCLCDESNAQSLLPFRYWLRNYFTQQPSQSLAENQACFRHRFAALVAATPDAELAAELTRLRSLLAALVDIIDPHSLYSRLQPEQRRENFVQAINVLIKAESLLQPLILHIEDAQWIDTDSHALLGMLLRDSAAYPFAIIVTTRPAAIKQWTPPAVPQQMIRLTAFDRTAVRALAQQQLGTEPDDTVVELLVAKGGGNPFYTEQLLRYLWEYGLVVGGKLVKKANRPAEDVLLPLDLHNILTARLNQFSPRVREVVKCAAVLGQEFSLPVLRQLVNDSAMLEASITAATEAAIWRPISAVRYRFNHGLLHEAAYTSQLDERRRQIHGEVAQVFSMMATPAHSPFATMARHYDEAGNRQRAVQNYLKAGNGAKENYFLQEAYRYYQRGLALAETDDDRLQLYLGRETINYWLGNREEQQADLNRLVELVVASGDQSLLVDVTLRRATLALTTAAYDVAIHHAQQASALAVALFDRSAEARAYRIWGRALWQQGKAKAAAPILKRALRLAQASAEPLEQALCHYDLATIAFYHAQYQAAQTEYTDAYRFFTEIDDKHNMIRCTDALGQIAVSRHEFEAAMHSFEQVLALSQTVDWSYGRMYGLAHLGDCYFELGNYDRCRQLHQQAVTLARTLGEQRAEAISLDTIGLSYYFEGNLTTARDYLQDALALQEARNLVTDKAFVQTHLGLTLADLEEVEQAGIHLYAALAIRTESSGIGAAIDTEAALAWLDLARGDGKLAVERVREVLATLRTNGIDGIELPLLVYWQCYTVLQSMADPLEVRALLEEAHAQLQTMAQRIQDETLRHQYLTNIRYHRELVHAWSSLT